MRKETSVSGKRLALRIAIDLAIAIAFRRLVLRPLLDRLVPITALEPDWYAQRVSGEDLP